MAGEAPAGGAVITGVRPEGASIPSGSSGPSPLITAKSSRDSSESKCARQRRFLKRPRITRVNSSHSRLLPAEQISLENLLRIQYLEDRQKSKDCNAPNMPDVPMPSGNDRFMQLLRAEN